MLINDIYGIESPKKDEARACLTALFLTYPKDDREKLIQTKGPIVDGTCEWIKTNKLYDSWFRSHSQLLWLSGGPGKGKTMLSIFIAKELERTLEGLQDVSFLQYFCDNKDDKRNTAVAIIRGMIFQLLQLQPKLMDYILPSFEIHNKSLFTASSFETLWRIFETMLRDPVLGTTYCVLDGLDECDEASLEVLLKKFRALLQINSSESSPVNLNLIVVSRGLPDFIPEILSSFPRIQLDPDADTEVTSDIDRFIEVKVDELSVYKRYSELLRERVKKVFQDRAQGTFLWVGIIAQELRKYKVTEVEKALDLFPPGLDELYARIILQIDVDRRETAAKILLWTVMAVRPLTLLELSIAVDVKPSAGLSRDEVIRDQMSYCGYFLTIKEDKVGLIHQSAKDYLLRKSRDPNPELENFRVKKYIGNLEIARKCFYYLQNSAFADGQVNLEERHGIKDISRLKEFPLLSYAAIHWPEHARSLARSEDIFSLPLPFYAKKSLVRESWLKTYWDTKMFQILPNSFTVLHLASFFGILPLAENLVLKKGWIGWVNRLFYVNRRDSYGWTALHWAARGEHEAVVRLLLEKGADVKTKTKDGETALFWAVREGHKAVVRLLLKKMADVETKADNGKTVLHGAALRGHEAIVRLLLEKGANIETKADDGGTALHWAVLGGNEAVVQLLLEKKADVEAKTDVEAKADHGRTALDWAALRGNEAIVQLLLEKGADVKAKASDGRTALQWAAQGGHEAVVRLLLEKGADVETKADDGETVLDSAAWGGNEAIVQLLLEKGADVKAKTDDGETALYWAVKGGHMAIVRLLTPLNS
jgi:ankyrin repeat protein